MALKISTVHIFGYGEVQVIGSDVDENAPKQQRQMMGRKNNGVNHKVGSASLTKLAAVVDGLYAKKPADNAATADYHSINIFWGTKASYNPKGDFEGWSVNWAEIDTAALDALVAEVLADMPAPVTP